MSENVVHVFCDCPDCVKRDMIVVRLKERIKFCKEFIDSGGTEKPQTRMIVEELQKILEGEK